MTSQHTGTGDFRIALIDHEDEVADIAPYAEDDYSGAGAFGIEEHQFGMAGLSLSRVDVTAVGEWEISVEPIAEAPMLTDAGTGDGIFLYDDPTTPVTVSYTGDDFVAMQLPEHPAPETSIPGEDYIGSDDDSPVDWELAAGPSLIIIEARGDWRIQSQ